MSDKFFSRNQSTNTGGDKYFRPECKNCQHSATKGKAEAYKRAGKPKRPPLGTPCDNPACRRTDRKLVFDHDHITLEHRGWLCDNCNRSMGMLGDTIESLELAVLYLKGQHKMRLIQGNCLEVMNDIDAQSIDLILCDLPYGTTDRNGSETKKNRVLGWDNVIPLDQLWEHYRRILSPKVQLF